MDFKQLTQSQLRSLCFEMAKLFVFRETESAFSNVFSLLDLAEPSGFDYDSEPGSVIYERLEDILTKLSAEKFILMATYYPDEFLEQVDENEVLSDFVELEPDSTDAKLAEFFAGAADSYF